MSEVKKIARAEIEFDAQGLEDGRIEFELEGEKWVAVPDEQTGMHRVRMCVQAMKYVKKEFGCKDELAWQLVKAALGLL